MSMRVDSFTGFVICLLRMKKLFSRLDFLAAPLELCLVAVPRFVADREERKIIE